jgi:hypothetical protein
VSIIRILGADPGLDARGADHLLVEARRPSDGAVREAQLLGGAQQLDREAPADLGLQRAVDRLHGGELVDEPPVDVRDLGELLGIPAAPQRLQDAVEDVRVRFRELREDLLQRTALGGGDQVCAGVRHADRLQQRFREGGADAHDLPDALHRRSEASVRLGELVEVEAGELHHDIIHGGLETGRGGSRDAVAQLG